MLVPEEQVSRCSRRSARAYRSIKVGAADASRRHDGPGHQCRAAGEVRAARRSWPRNTAARSSAVAADRPGWIAATISSRPCSTSRITRIPLREKRSSVPSSACSATGTSTMPSKSPTTASTDCRRRCTAPMSPPPSAVGEAAAHRRGQRQHHRLQRLRAEWWLQAERPRPRTGSRRDPRISRSQTHVDRGASTMTSTITKPRSSRREHADRSQLADLGRRSHPRAAEPVGGPRRFQGQGPRPPHGGRRQGHGRLGLRRQEDAQFGLECRRGQVQGGVQPRATELLGDASRVLRRQGPSRGHGPSLVCLRRCAFRLCPGSAGSCSWRPATASSASSACRSTTTGSSRNGAVPPRAATSR